VTTLPPNATGPTGGFAVRGPGHVVTKLKVYQNGLHIPVCDDAQGARRQSNSI